MLTHSRILHCSICSCDVHIQCLSNVTCIDSIYTERFDNSWICTLCAQDIFPFNSIEDDEVFLRTVRSCLNSVINNYDLSLLNKMTFQTFELYEDSNNGDTLDELNPDLQYFNDQICLNNTSCCKYFNIVQHLTVCVE